MKKSHLLRRKNMEPAGKKGMMANLEPINESTHVKHF